MGLLRSLHYHWRSFPRNIRIFFHFDLTYQLAVTVYALYFPRYLLALGQREDTLGGLLAAGTLCMALVATFAGLLSDRIGRRRSLLYGVTVSKAAFLARGFMVSLPALYGTYIIDGVFITLYSAAATPFIFENTLPDQRISAFSMHGILQRISGIMGNLIGGLLPSGIVLVAPQLDELGLYRVIFAIAVVLAALGIAQLFSLREPEGETPVQASVRPVVDRRLSREESVFIWKYIATSAILTFGAGHWTPFMNTYLIQTYAASPAAVGLFLSAAQVAVIVGIALAPVLAQRKGLIRSIVVTRFLALPLLVLLALATNIWVAWVTYAIRNTLQQMSTPLTNTFVLSQLDRRTRATANGMLHAVDNAVRAVAMFTGGRVIIAYGYPAMFLVAFVAYTLSAWLFYEFFARRPLAGMRDVNAVDA